MFVHVTNLITFVNIHISLKNVSSVRLYCAVKCMVFYSDLPNPQVVLMSVLRHVRTCANEKVYIHAFFQGSINVINVRFMCPQCFAD